MIKVSLSIFSMIWNQMRKMERQCVACCTRLLILLKKNHVIRGESSFSHVWGKKQKFCTGLVDYHKLSCIIISVATIRRFKSIIGDKRSQFQNRFYIFQNRFFPIFCYSHIFGPTRPTERYNHSNPTGKHILNRLKASGLLPLPP